MELGLFAADISLAITAPLTAAFALSGILNLNKSLNGIGFKPVAIIGFAQIANGILLPVISIFYCGL